MSHLDEGILHAVLDGEVPAIELATIEQHLATCRECQQRMTEARGFRSEAFALVESLDVAPMALGAARPIAALSPSRAPLSAAATPIRRRPKWVLPVAWAATLILAAGLGSVIRPTLAPDAKRAVQVVPEGDALVFADEDAKPEPTAAITRDDSIKQQPEVAAAKAKQAGGYRARGESTARPVPAAAPVSAAPAPESARQVLAAEQSDARKPDQPAAGARAREVDATSTLAEARATPKESKDEGGAERAPAAAPSRRVVDTDLGRGGAAANSLRKEVLRLDRPAPPNPADQRIRTISAVAAIRALGGSLRLVDGLEPARFELLGEVVRVVYRTDWGVVMLEQWRAGELLAYELNAPVGTPADSVLAWERRIR